MSIEICAARLPISAKFNVIKDVACPNYVCCEKDDDGTVIRWFDVSHEEARKMIKTHQATFVGTSHNHPFRQLF